MMHKRYKKADVMKTCNITSDEYSSIYKSFIKFNKEKKELQLCKIGERSADNLRDRKLLSTPLVSYIDSLCDKFGVYALVNDDDLIIYVGVSKDLKNRVKESYLITPDAAGIRVIETKSLSDAYILEVMLINIIKPMCNKGTLSDDKSTFKVPKIYDIRKIETVWN